MIFELCSWKLQMSDADSRKREEFRISAFSTNSEFVKQVVKKNFDNLIFRDGTTSGEQCILEVLKLLNVFEDDVLWDIGVGSPILSYWALLYCNKVVSTDINSETIKTLQDMLCIYAFAKVKEDDDNNVNDDNDNCNDNNDNDNSGNDYDNDAVDDNDQDHNNGDVIHIEDDENIENNNCIHVDDEFDLKPPVSWSLIEMSTHEIENAKLILNELQQPISEPGSIMFEIFDIVMTNEIFKCLLPRGWINARIINVFMSMLHERDPTSYYWDSEFIAKLIDPKTNVYSYNNVARWTKRLNVNVFKMDKVLKLVYT